MERFEKEPLFRFSLENTLNAIAGVVLLFVTLSYLVGTGTPIIVWLAIAGTVFYFLPTIVAGYRKHRNAASLFLVNFFLGWTLAGWVIAFSWSFMAKDTITA